jgi:hypothetical protein
MFAIIGSILLFGYLVWQVAALIWFASQCRDVARDELQRRSRLAEESQRHPRS